MLGPSIFNHSASRVIGLILFLELSLINGGYQEMMQQMIIRSSYKTVAAVIDSNLIGLYMITV